jgi:poly(3-hydroxyalkanoate) synthetase
MAVISLGISRIEPEKSDRQFIHPAWRGQTGYRRLSQAYLAWSRSVNGLADRLETPDWRTREQLRFVLELCTSGASPTNCLLGNPAALQKALDSGGTSLLRGAKNWLHDVLHNRGMPTQVDSSSFKVGENLALTPGSVVYCGERTFVLSNAGHIASLVNPPGNTKAHHFTGPVPTLDADDWLALASEQSGTWWKHWADWVSDRAGAERSAPKMAGRKRYGELEPAPGRYIHE